MTTPDLNRIQKNVLAIIKDFPQAANDEAALLDQYWHRFDNWNDTQSLYYNLSKVTRPETITRRRRELYNLGLIDYSDEATKQREEAFNNERERAAPQAVSWLND